MPEEADMVQILSFDPQSNTFRRNFDIEFCVCRWEEYWQYLI